MPQQGLAAKEGGPSQALSRTSKQDAHVSPADTSRVPAEGQRDPIRLGRFVKANLQGGKKGIYKGFLGRGKK